MHILKDNGEDDSWRITENYHPLRVSLRLLYFLCLFHAVSLKHLVLSIMLFYTSNLCRTIPHKESVHNLCQCFWLASPAAITLSVLCATDVICKFTAWNIKSVPAGIQKLWLSFHGHAPRKENDGQQYTITYGPYTNFCVSSTKLKQS